MSETIRVLLQTTIEPTADDWGVRRFSLLREFLESAGKDSDVRFKVDARDRATSGRPDPVLSALDRSDYDEAWLFAVDTGDGLDPADCAGISRFRRRGGGLLVGPGSGLPELCHRTRRRGLVRISRGVARDATLRAQHCVVAGATAHPVGGDVPSIRAIKMSSAPS